MRNLKALTVEEGKPVSLKCVVSGGFPSPSVHIFLKDRNITDEFPLYRACSVVGVSGLNAASCNQERWLEGFAPPARYDGSEFKCVASVPGLPTEVATLTLQIMCKLLTLMMAASISPSLCVNVYARTPSNFSINK